MGKHDKQNKVEPATKFSWQPMPDEFYKERIKKLESEIIRLKEELIDTQHNLAIVTSLYEKAAERASISTSKQDEIIERKNEEIEMAKEAIYLAAMREVSLR